MGSQRGGKVGVTGGGLKRQKTYSSVSNSKLVLTIIANSTLDE